MMLTDRQREAYVLASRGYTQSQIAELMTITRESANRLIARAKRRVNQLRLACAVAGHECQLVDSLVK